MDLNDDVAMETKLLVYMCESNKSCVMIHLRCLYSLLRILCQLYVNSCCRGYCCITKGATPVT